MKTMFHTYKIDIDFFQHLIDNDASMWAWSNDNRFTFEISNKKLTKALISYEKTVPDMVISPFPNPIGNSLAKKILK